MTKRENSDVSWCDSRATIALVCVFLIAITWFVFGQTVRYDFVNYDDDNYVYANPLISSGLTVPGAIHAFIGKHAGNWHPLTTLSHMLDCQLWGLRPGGHHLTNVALHIIAVVFLFLILLQMTGALWRSTFVAAVFAIHPLRVESVAWVSERKDVLSAVFFMLTLGFYARYVRHSSLGRYLAVVGLFALGLMCKPTLVTVPLVLLLLDYWPLRRYQKSEIRSQKSEFAKLIIEKIPLFALSAAAAGATLWAQEKTIVHIERLPFMWRVGNGLVACLTYIEQMIWPARLAVFYPHPARTLPLWEIGLAIVLLGVVSGGAIALRHKRPYLVTGWFWYLIMLLPVIGLVQVGAQAHADRYTYLSQIGLYIVLAWAIPDALSSRIQRQILGVAAGVAIIVLACCARIQVSYWRNSETLWSHAIAVNSEKSTVYPVVRMNLGIALLKKGRADEAIAQFQAVLKDRPNDASAYDNIGTALLGKGDSQSAIAAYQKALSIQSRYPSAHFGLGMALDDSGRVGEAIAHYQEAIREDPDFAEAYYVLGNDLLRASHTEAAIAAYERALQSRPVYPEVENNLGLALLNKGRPGEAIAHWKHALANEPDSLPALNSLAWVLAAFPDASIRNGDEALRLADHANRLSGSKDPTVLRTLAAAYAENGRFTEATATAQSGLQLANTQGNSAMAKIFESDLAHYRANTPVRIPLPTR
ncbi:MAG: tetratricopeptide repeat protein [Candidatus Udaeobacter sp.]